MNFSDWKTTIPGFVSAAGAFVMFAPSYGVHFPAWVTAVGAFVTMGGLAALGINATSVPKAK